MKMVGKRTLKDGERIARSGLSGWCRKVEWFARKGSVTGEEREMLDDNEEDEMEVEERYL